jgi:hypothetical protein
VALAIAAPGLSQGSSSSRISPVPMTIQVVLTKGEGEKKVSMPYSLTTSSGEIASLRVGAEVPIGTTGGAFTFQQFGTQIDSRVIAADGRYKVQITITKREVYEGTSAPQIQQGDPSQLILYNFVFAGTVLLGNGETAQISGTDLVTNETWRADVTLSLKR